MPTAQEVADFAVERIADAMAAIEGFAGADDELLAAAALEQLDRLVGRNDVTDDDAAPKDNVHYREWGTQQAAHLALFGLTAGKESAEDDAP